MGRCGWLVVGDEVSVVAKDRSFDAVGVVLLGDTLDDHAIVSKFILSLAVGDEHEVQVGSLGTLVEVLWIDFFAGDTGADHVLMVSDCLTNSASCGSVCIQPQSLRRPWMTVLRSFLTKFGNESSR